MQRLRRLLPMPDWSAASLADVPLGLAALALIGWCVPAIAAWYVSHPLSVPRPATLLTGLFVTRAFRALARHDRAAARTAGGIAGVLAVIGVLAAIGHRPPPVDALFAWWLPTLAMPLPAAVGAAQQFAAMVLAMVTFVLARPHVSPRRLLACTTAGILLLAIMMVRALLAGTRQGYGEAPIGQLSVLGMVLTVLTCLVLFMLIAERQETPHIPPPGSAEIAGGVAALAAIGFAHALEVRVSVASIGSSPRAAAIMRELPHLALVLGLCVAALLTLILRLLRSNWMQARRLEHERLSTALESATDGVWEYDFVAQRGQRSASQLRHLGYEPVAFNADADSWRRVIHPDDLPRVLEEVALRSAQSGDDGEMRYRVLAADGSAHTIVDRGRVIERTADGRPKLMIGISADVTERLRADEARLASERRYRALFASALQGQVLLDADGRCLDVNGAALAIVGADRGEVIGVPITQAVWFTGLADAQAALATGLERALAGESGRFEIETHRLDGRVGALECSLTPVPDVGPVQEVLCELRDITMRRRSEEALREIGALTTIGRLAARVAHEINNPLAGIRNAFLLLADVVPEAHPHRRFVHSIEREIDRIAMVTRALYETYRADQERSAEASLTQAVADAVRFLEQVNRGRGVRIVVDVDAAPQHIPVPDAVLRQTLYNLVQNAVEASPTGGTVTVRGWIDHQQCIITVADEGVPIPPALREKIFDPGGGRHTASSRTGPMGIGLAIVRRSLEALGGTVRLLDEPQGATFEVRLPMQRVWTDAWRAPRSVTQPGAE